MALSKYHLKLKLEKYYSDFFKISYFQVLKWYWSNANSKKEQYRQECWFLNGDLLKFYP